MSRILLVSLLALAACDDKSLDTADTAVDAGKVTLEIASPEAGATYTFGSSVNLDLDVEREGGGAVVFDSVLWTVAGSEWSFEGDGGDVTDLPEGELTLEVEAEVDGRTLTDSVSFVVEVPREPVAFSGPMDADVELYSATYNLELDDECPGFVAFTIQPDDTFSGTGQCSAFDQDVDFLIVGSITDGVVTGEMTLADQPDEAMPFSGTGTYETTIQASYDKTWKSGDGTLRVFGTFTANPPE